MKCLSPVMLLLLLALVPCLVCSPHAHAWITGGKGSAPLDDPGWPDGAATIFNHKGRVAWWEGPPFGGGQYHAECRGDTESFNEVLAQFAKLKVADKRLIVEAGVGHSFWLNPNKEDDKKRQAEIDWRLMIWVPGNWERLSKLPLDLNPTNKNDQGPPTEIQLFAGGNIRWDDVNVPEGIEVIDNRMEAHGYSASDGVVLEGTVTDLVSGEALMGRIELREVKPKKTGGYDYSQAAEAATNANGKWVIKHAPQGRFQVVAFAKGYVPRIVGYKTVEDQPSWKSYQCGLSRSSEVTGKITDEEGEPLADARVRLANVAVGDGERYASIGNNYTTNTDNEGNFTLTDVPIGSATVGCYKEGYFRAGLGKDVTIPQDETIELAMSLAAKLEVVVLFHTTEPPDDYIVELEPAGGSAVGKWSGSSKINDENKVVFRNIPPGKYALVGHPNPTAADEKTLPISIELFGGKSRSFTLHAKQ
ncbi:carboxypeptidase-like regulatory domain-containing protein [Pirellulales bacterium]|nr:carboxypeptidase-like regulatory domain-containing protein [Pirellulales bacterium]